MSIMSKENHTHKVASPSVKADKLQHRAETFDDVGEREFPSDCPYPACYVENIEQIEHAKKEWELTADLMQKIVCLLDEDGHILRVNLAVERWGLGKVAAARGRTMHELLHPDCVDANCSLKRFWDAIPDMMGKDGSTECQIEDKILGRYLQLTFRSSQSIHDANAHIQKNIGVAVVNDISDLKLAEKKLQELNHELEHRVEARTAELLAANKQLQKEIEEHRRADVELRKSREEFRLLVETMSEGLIICNKKGLVTYINDRFCEMLGRSREDIIGRPASECIEGSSPEGCNQLTAKVEVGLAVSDELKLKRQKGDEVWVKVSPSLLYDQHGKISGSFAVITDISDRMRAEQILRASENRLRQLSEQVMSAQEKERQRVAAELHDGIGQTLSAVKFSVETGISRICEQPSEESFRLLEGVIPKIQDAIEEVRRISMALRPSILDDIGILATLTWFCRESSLVYTDLRIQLQLDIKEEVIPVQVKVVIFRIVQEALNNAVKHSNAELMRITLNHTDATVELNIEDNGVGFDVRKICANGKRVLGGLGLTSMRERAEHTGGIYSLESNQGKGTKIRVTWPV